MPQLKSSLTGGRSSSRRNRPVRLKPAAPFLASFLAFLLALVTGAALLAGGPVRPAAAQPRFDFPPDTTRAADQSLYFETNLGLIERATAEAVDQALEGLNLPPGSDVLLHTLTPTQEGVWFVEDYMARRLSQDGYNVHMQKVPQKEEKTTGAEAGSRPRGNPAGNPGGLADAMRQTNPSPADSDSVAAPADSTAAPATSPRRPGPKLNQPQQRNAPVEEEEEIPVPEGEGIVLTFRLVEFGVTYHDSWRRGFMGPRVVERLASVNLYCRLVSGGPENVLWVGRGKSERLDIVPKSKLDLLEGLSYPFTRPTLRPRPISRLLEPVLVTSIIGGLVYLFYTNQE